MAARSDGGGNEVTCDLTLIDLDQPREGYRQFLSAWLGQSDGVAFVVDPGPRSTVRHLIERIRGAGVERLDYVLVTHIHLDHAGGSTELLEAFPEARFYCHPAGAKHVVEPTQLWRGSQKVLKEIAGMYGEPRPVPAERIAAAEELERRGFGVIPTPGHAVHHVSFLRDGTLFAGEVFGTRSPMPDGALYMRPATPPRFFLDQLLASIDKLLALPEEPEEIAFAHYGKVPGGFDIARKARAQILRWVEAARELAPGAASRERLDDLVFARLQEIDPLHGQGLFDRLDPDVRARERYFLHNSLDGILGWLEG
jgi:glyoxylase-like metal-dependent hydrolase (beta-lactamase superfamily II)